MPYRSVEDPAKLRRLLEAVLLLEGDLRLPDLLRHFVEEACSMAAARYGALGLLNEDRTGLAQFITVGLAEKEERAIGERPTGLGVLGLLISDPKPLRLADLADHPASAGFPPGHPPMRSFLGVPVTAHEQVYGNLYLTEKIGSPEFTQDDEALALTLAQAAGIAIENARLHQRVRDVAVFQDRARIARDLHDSVIQRLFAVGLSLQGVARPPVDPGTAERIQASIDEIDGTIRQLRTSIFDLASEEEGGGPRAGVMALVNELRPVTGLEVAVTFDGPVDSALSEEVTEQLLLGLRESLMDVARRSVASRASVEVRVADGLCALEISVSNGQGADEAPGGEGSRAAGEEQGEGQGAGGGGFGMASLRRRADQLGGDLVVRRPAGGGTTVLWRVPIDGSPR
jgi:signal transduction histidine kinase